MPVNGGIYTTIGPDDQDADLKEIFLQSLDY